MNIISDFAGFEMENDKKTFYGTENNRSLTDLEFGEIDIAKVSIFDYSLPLGEADTRIQEQLHRKLSPLGNADRFLNQKEVSYWLPIEEFLAHLDINV